MHNYTEYAERIMTDYAGGDENMYNCTINGCKKGLYDMGIFSYSNMRHVLLDIMDFFEIKTEYEDVIEVCTCIV